MTRMIDLYNRKCSMILMVALSLPSLKGLEYYLDMQAWCLDQ
jgi:hypothetical protein